MKLYTKRGDDGGTDLFAGGRTTKTDPRIHAIGEVDETNASLGLAVAACESDASRVMKKLLTQLQCRLFDLGADLATPDPARPRRITQAHIDELEQQIDAASDAVPPMKHFILPGGCELATRLHLARTVCRRAERACVALHEVDPGTARVVVFLNRLSDLLFALARMANQQAGIADVPWESGRVPGGK